MVRLTDNQFINDRLYGLLSFQTATVKTATFTLRPVTIAKPSANPLNLNPYPRSNLYTLTTPLQEVLLILEVLFWLHTGSIC